MKVELTETEIEAGFGKELGYSDIMFVCLNLDLSLQPIFFSFGLCR